MATNRYQKYRAFELGAKPRVCIIGAGISGLRCADVLLRHGFDVTILEGRNRVGGRVHQQTLKSGHDIDMGPNWIHGTDQNPIHDLAKETNTVIGSWDDSTNIFDEQGALFSQEEGETYSTTMWNIIQDAFAYSNKSCSEIDPSRSLLDFFEERVEEKIPTTEPSFESKRKIILQMCHMWGAFVGSPVSTQSLKYFWLEECIDGENLLCAGTYKQILQTIAKPALDADPIQYNTTVQRITRLDQAGSQVSVTTNTNQTLEFDEVICTTPLGWLKRNKDSAFEPPLPHSLSSAIDKIGYGCLEKVYVNFPEAFWLQSSDKAKKTKGFAQWISPEYATSTNPHKWHQEMVELASIDPRAAHPTLLFYIFGDQSRHVTSTLANLDTREQKQKFLASMFEPCYSRLHNYNASDPKCQPIEFVATEWLNDELAGNGSYANFQIGLEDGDKAIEIMREGLPDYGLWFAGEHAAPFVALGTATGAYWSGELVAKRIVEAYNRTETPTREAE